MWSRRPSAGAAGAAVVASLFLPASAPAASRAAGQLTATAGAWRASFTYLHGGDGPATYSHLRVRVVRHGIVVLDAPVVSRIRYAAYLQPGGFGTNRTISFRDLDGDGTPELVLSLFTGGAHCCSIEQVYDLTRATPRKTEISFGDSGASVIRASGQTVFRSADDAFAYAFTDYADSGAPIQVWAYARGRFSDVTRRFPTLIRKDAALWWKGYRGRLKSREDERGILSAWAADAAMLGEGAAARDTLDRIAAGGSLDWGLGAPKGAVFVRRLWAFLGRQGYLR